MSGVKFFILSCHLVIFVILSTGSSSIYAQSEGEWSGITDNSQTVHLVVSGDTVDFEVEVCPTGGSQIFDCFYQLVTSIPISDETFNFSGLMFDVTGTFTNINTASGTYAFHDSVMGYDNGTWSASFPAVPSIEYYPSSISFGEQQVDSTSDVRTLTITNKSGGNATGSIYLTGSNTDQFEIVNGGGSFSLLYLESKNVEIRFLPNSTGLKSATLEVDANSPCNDVSSSISGTGTIPMLSIAPGFQMVQESSGSTNFSISNTGPVSTDLSWTAEVNPSDTWLTISAGNAGTNSGTISVNYDTNYGDARIGTIVVSAPDAPNSPQTIQVLQAANRSAKTIANDGAADDNFGYSVSISGDYAVAGAYKDDDNGTDSGSAYIFRRNENGWTQQAKLLPDDGAVGDYFGYSVSISGDYAIVGAYKDDDNGTDSGSAYIFQRTENGWIQMAKLLSEDGAAGDSFGRAVSISGDVVIVGADGDDDNGYNSGSAYIFKKPMAGWSDITETAKLKASDGYGHYDPYVPAFDGFGYAVSISGEYAIVGTMAWRTSGTGYIFKEPTGGWANMTETAKLTPSDEGTPDSICQFGHSVSISGDYAVVGAENSLTCTNIQSGRAYIFEKPSSGWVDMTESAKVYASDGGNLKNRFGASVVLSGDSLIVGAPWNDEMGYRSGTVYLFLKPLGGWVSGPETKKIEASDGSENDNLGASVNISGDYIIAGAYGDDDNGESSGSVLFSFIGNISPDISDIKDQLIYENTSTEAINFTVSDSETLPGNLILIKASSNIELVPNENIIIEGTEANRSMTITPNPNVTGTTTITVTVSDGIVQPAILFYSLLFLKTKTLQEILTMTEILI